MGFTQQAAVRPVGNGSQGLARIVSGRSPVDLSVKTPNSMNPIFNKTAIFIGAISFAGVVQADWNTQSFNVTANVAQGCLIAVKTHMAFGTLDVISAAGAQSNATFDVTCTNGSGAVSLTFGSANGAAPPPASTFKMINGTGDTTAKRIVYELYTAEAALIAIDTVTPFAALLADGTVRTLTITGKISSAAMAGALAGAYTDVVTMTATYAAL